MNKSNKTAITRNKPSAPAKLLYKEGALKGQILDYGCGKGFDAKHYNMDKYDPYYQPEKPKKKYDTITCTYVLNTIEEKEEQKVINKIRKLLKKDGKAYITVRREIKKEGQRSIGTLQRNVVLNLPIFKETYKFCIYMIEN